MSTSLVNMETIKTEVPWKSKTIVSLWPSHTMPNYLKKIKSICHRDLCILCLTTVLFIIAKAWNQPRYSSEYKWIKKIWLTYKMEFYPPIKRDMNILFTRKWIPLGIIKQINSTSERHLCITILTNYKKKRNKNKKNKGTWWGFLSVTSCLVLQLPCLPLHDGCGPFKLWATTKSTFLKLHLAAILSKEQHDNKYTV